MLAGLEIVSTVIGNKGIKQYLHDLVFMHYVVIYLVWRPLRALARIADKSILTVHTILKTNGYQDGFQ